MANNFDLCSGKSIPSVGLGTWMADNDKELEDALNAALEVGYRHIDAALAYQNEHVIGKVLKQWISSGKLAREDLFITTKLPPWAMSPESVPKFLKKSLGDLQLDYIDMYLIHVPFAFTPYEGKPFGTKKDGSIDYDTNIDHVKIWKAMEEQVEQGLVKSIGVSNFNKKQIGRILNNSKIAPSNLQIEHHVYLQQPDLIKYCKDNNIVVTAYSPLGSPGITKLGKDVPEILSNSVVVKISKKYNKTPAQVLIRHIVQKGIVAIPKSTNPVRLRQNFDVNFTLNQDDMKELNALDQGLRIVDFEFMFKGVNQHPEYPFPELI